MKITSINVNGIRAATKIRENGSRGLIDWIKQTDSDFICLQETRASLKQVEESLEEILSKGWNLFLAESDQKGRNGVAILSKKNPKNVSIGFGDNEFTNSGRYIVADFEDYQIASLYFPSGEVNTSKQDEKMRFSETFYKYLDSVKDKNIIISGDWNIAHTELDIKNWKGNQKKSGFLPEEREWLTKIISLGFIDVTRELYPNQEGPYTWWSYRGKAFDNNAGWRIDYQFATKKLAEKALSSEVDKAKEYNLRWSDHSPLTIEYKDN